MFLLTFLLYALLGNVFKSQNELAQAPHGSKDIPKQSGYVTKLQKPCPTVGYYFDRAHANALSGSCYLCFCKENNTAVCWPRDNKRCDEKYYRHFGKRDARRRRSLPGDNILLENNIRIAEKAKGKACKPNEASFSEGCPPKDWCKGCTVCDCNKDGRWDCHILSFCPENEKLNSKKGNSRRVYKMKGVTKANPPQAVKFNKTKRPKSNLKPKERIIRREATRRMKQSKRRKNVYHPAATPRGQTYKTTTRSRHRVRNGAAFRRLADNMKAQIFKNEKINKSTQPKSAQKHVTKQNRKFLQKKQTQPKKTSPPKQITQHAKEKPKNNQFGKHSSSKITVKNDKIIALTKKIIVPTTSIAKPTGIPKTTKSIDSSKNTKVTKPNVLTTNKKTTKIVSTSSKDTYTTIVPTRKGTQQQQFSTTNTKTVIDKMLNQQILKTSNSKDAKVIKRSLVKKFNVAKSKKLTQVHANKTKTKYVKTIPRKLQKRSKIYLEKSNNVKVNKRHKRDVDVSTASDKTLYKATIADFAYPQNTLQDFKPTAVERLPSTTELPIAYYRYTIDNLNKTTGVGRIDFTRVIPLNLKKNTEGQSLDMGKVLSNLTVLQLKATNTSDTHVTLLDVKNFTVSNWPSIIFQNNEILPTKEIGVEYTHINTTPDISESLKPENFSLKPEQTLLSQKRNAISKEMTIVSVPKKHKLKKVVSILANKSLRIEDFNQTAVTNRSVSRRVGKFDGLKNFMHNFVTGLHQNNETRTRSKKNRFKIIKYLKKFFKKLFSKMKHKERNNNKTVLPQLNKKSVIEILCETFGPCNINLKNKRVLQRDIDALNAETYKMLRSIKIIKGLLKLLDFARHDRELPNSKNVTRKTAFKHDIHKLHSILIGTYVTEENLDKLTETQKCQLNYVKNNTQSFIKSATKFALILNDIINILTVVNTSVVRENNTHATIINNIVPKNYSKLNAEKVENFTRVSRDALVNETIKTGKICIHDKIHDDPFNKIKKLIMKYNFLQNTFMKKIYKLIANFDEIDVKAINKEVSRTAIKALNVSDDSFPNKTAAIRTYTKNIIKNLRKLKDLAQRLKFSNRKKRELKDDDSLEYLLMLMEYLLKQNHPQDASSASDGIDVLIDAIKQAPHIKSIPKKVLVVTTTESSRIKVLTEVNSSESMSDIKFSKEDKSSKEDIKFSKEDNSSSQAEEFKLGYHRFNLNDPNIDDEEGDDSFILNKRAKPLLSTNRLEYYVKENPSTPAIQALIGGSSPASLTKNLPKQLTPSIVFATSGEIVRQVDFDKDEKKDNSLKFDVFDGDVEEELVTSSSSTVSPDTTEMYLELIGESTPESLIFSPKVSSSPSSIEKEDSMAFKRIFRDSEINVKGDNSEPGDVSASQSKSKLDWLEETYEEEMKGEVNQTETENTTQTAMNAATAVAMHRRNVNIGRNDNASNISKDEERKRRKQSAEDLIYRKEMDLLNSLDYGTGEKSEKEGSNSKESTEDKYAVDAFEGYFA